MTFGTRRTAAACAALALLATSCSSGSDGRRKANPFEVVYAGLAPRLRTPDLCEKISRRAFLSAGWGGEGHQITYTRSDCYHALALATGDAGHCTQVVEADHWWLDGSQVSEAACLRDLGQGEEPRSGGGDPEWALRFMGFLVGDGDDSAWIELYYSLTRDELQERAARLPDFSRAAGAVPVGVDARGLGCERERDEAWYCHARRCLDSGDESFREACLEVAAFHQTRQRERALGNAFPPSPRVRDLLRKHPALRTSELP